MSKLSEMYGRFECLFHGKGKLNGVDCEFEIGQQSDGNIYLRCQSQELLPNNNDNIELIGFAYEGPVHVNGKVIRTTVRGNYDYYYCNAGKLEMNVGELDWGSAHTAKFAITNFKLIGNEKEEFSTGGWRRTDIKLKLDDVNISFQKVEMYDSIIESLERNKNTEITCELAIEVDNQAQEKIIEIVNRVCSLLTIARGTKINWISYNLFESKSRLICNHCEPRITVPYAGIALVKPINIPKSTISFLKQCYPTYKERNSQYHFDDIGNFLVDIHSRGFLETRCLLLFSVAEVLTRSLFDNNEPLKRLRDFVDEHNVSVEKCRQKKCGRGCGTCSPKCKECKTRCELNCEIGKFIQDRNEFVHRMRFPNDNITEGYYRNLNFLHRMILSALKYKGELYDWSEGGPVSA